MNSINELNALLQLLGDYNVYMRGKEYNYKPYILLNDVFGWACSDSEEFEISEAPYLLTLAVKYGDCGLHAWASLKRKEWVERGDEHVIDDCFTKEFKLAREEIKLAGKK